MSLRRSCAYGRDAAHHPAVLFEMLGVQYGVLGGAVEGEHGRGTIKTISGVADSNIATISGSVSFTVFRMAPLEGIIIREARSF